MEFCVVISSRMVASEGSCADGGMGDEGFGELSSASSCRTSRLQDGPYLEFILAIMEEI